MATVKKVKAKISVGKALRIAQHYVGLREERLALQKEVDAIQEDETFAKLALMDMLRALKVSSVGDTEKVYALVPKDEPTIEDWEPFYKHVKRTGHFDLMHKRINTKAVKDRWDAGKEVPGVKHFPVQVLSVTKAKGAS